MAVQNKEGLIDFARETGEKCPRNSKSKGSLARRHGDVIRGLQNSTTCKKLGYL